MKPCEFRQVADDGRIFCDKITAGQGEVTPQLCGTCPVAAIACDHLRFTLEQVESRRLVVRYGNGHQEVWDDGPPHVAFVQAACATKVMPIAGPRDCRGCALRSRAGQASVAQPVAPHLVARRPPAAAAPRPRRAAQRGRLIPFPTVSVAGGQ